MSDATPPQLPPAGWYADPRDQNQERWWSGEAWTDHIRSGLPTPPPPPAMTTANVPVQASDSWSPISPTGAPELQLTGDTYGSAHTTITPTAPQTSFSHTVPTSPSDRYTQKQIKAAEYRAARRRNIYGYLGCVLGLIAMIFDFFGIPSILAIVFGSIGIAAAGRLGGGKGTGVGWSISGLVLGVATLAFFIWNFYRLHTSGLL